ncbi:DUF2249 domain-containing protein [Paenibacillus ehimensis]|uniref:DUF2249 domain-containing protein n=1 Tax=Paenibacillus ehimensis TaxID=79264 RepID=A0ABT8V451_9BACL|nr:DUF2249 domain-containing protein [Paenibacillus ehimensis]MDO3676210.1 DUF2249 domain-containing protein [Paenibacillus ehimensis]MEC0210108.1 DUF2249 domain-containing protein [Paenibacillus ehimensis]
MKRDVNVVELDVRPFLRKKLEPFKQIMDAVDGLEPDDVFVLHALFKPTPLLGIMKAKGYANKVESVGDDHWITAFARGAGARAKLEAMSLQSFKDEEAGS